MISMLFSLCIPSDIINVKEKSIFCLTKFKSITAANNPRLENQYAVFKLLS